MKLMMSNVLQMKLLSLLEWCQYKMNLFSVISIPYGLLGVFYINILKYHVQFYGQNCRIKIICCKALVSEKGTFYRLIEVNFFECLISREQNSNQSCLINTGYTWHTDASPFTLISPQILLRTWLHMTSK